MADGGKEQQAGRRRPRYPLEYRRDVACLVLDQHRSIADVSREMDLISQTVGNWVRAEKIERGERDGLTREEREELVKLRREVKRLTQERDLLKRATAFWVKESDR